MNSNTNNKNIIIKSNTDEYVIDDKLKQVIDDIKALEIDNEKKIKMIKFVLSIEFDLKITNNPIIDEMLIVLIGEDIVKEVMRSHFKKSQKKYYDTHKEKFKARYKEKAEIIKEYKRNQMNQTIQTNQATQ